MKKDTDAAYTVTDIGSFSVTGMNSSGQVVGAITSVGQQAVLYSNGTLTSLGTLNEVSSYPQGINDSGQVVGEAYTTGVSSRAFLYENNKMIDLNTLIDPSLGLTLYDATAINNNGVISGRFSTSTESGNMFLYDHGIIHDLGILGVSSNILSINDSGQLAGGYQSTIGGYTHGISYSNGVFTDIGTLGGTDYICSGYKRKRSHRRLIINY